jgi:hypothetical protein
MAAAGDRAPGWRFDPIASKVAASTASGTVSLSARCRKTASRSRRSCVEFLAGNVTPAIMRTEDFGGTFSRNAMPIALQVARRGRRAGAA